MRRFLAFAALAVTMTVSACTGGVDPAAFDIGAQRLYDTKPIAFRTPAPQNFNVHGVDVAKWQGDIDWRLLKASGVSFAFIKATEGGDHIDAKFARNWQEAKRAGMLRGAYHFYYHCTPAADQARWFIRNVPREKGMLPPVLDMEWNGHSTTCPGKKGRAETLANMRTFLSMIERHYGTRPIIYSTVDFHRDIMQGEFRRYDHWLRSTKDHVDDVYPGRKGAWTFWQYTATGRASGVDEHIDLNAFRGNRRAWQAWVKRRVL